MLKYIKIKNNTIYCVEEFIMKIFKRSFFMVLLCASTVLFATGTNDSTIVAEDKLNPEMLNTLGATDIVDLTAYSSNGLAVCNFRIKSLPSETSGRLYMADGETGVAVEQNLTHEEVKGLTFNPKETFVGEAVFTYSAMDVHGYEGNLGSVTLPIIAPEITVPTVTVTTDDKLNAKMLNTFDAVNILNLSGKDGDGVAVSNFRIKSLPTPEAGTLYMEDGTTAVMVNQNLTKDESDGLKFDPKEIFIGDALFAYQAIDVNGVLGNIGTVTIPVIGEDTGTPDNNTSVEDCVCEDYNESLPAMSSIGIFLMIILSTLFGLFFKREELK